MPICRALATDIVNPGPLPSRRAPRCIGRKCTIRALMGVRTMIRKFGLAVIFSSMALPSLAAARCDQPYAPEVHLAANPTKEQISTLRDDVRTFIAASDLYQACLQKTMAGGGAALIAANQKEKERVGKLFNALLSSYKQANAQAPSSGNLELVSR